MYQYQPKRKNKIASALLLTFALVAVILLGLSVTLDSYIGILQLGVVICLSVDVLIFMMYFRRSFIYRIVKYDNSYAPDLTVSEVAGKDSIVLCRLSLDNLLSIEKSSQKAKRKLGKHHNYCVDIAPRDAYILRFEECGEKIAVILSPDEAMLSIFENYLSKNSQEENEP